MEITYRGGKPLAGYLYLPREADDTVARSRKAAPGLVVDYSPDGRPIGVEVTGPSSVSLDAINQVLTELHLETLDRDEFAPLLTQ